MKRLSYLILSAILATTFFTTQSCNKDDDKTEKKEVEVIPLENDEEKSPDQNEESSDQFPEITAANEVTHSDLDFAYGADPGWITAMEKQSKKFYNTDGNEADCFEILSGIGINAARFRVWVNPSNETGIWGLCNAEDVIKKAIRAQNAGMKIMIDFHYSDTWADPSNQKKPAAWDNAATVSDLADSAAAFTKFVLENLKAKNVDVNWVQIGNETRTGMMTTSSTGDSTTVNGNMGENYKTIHNKCAAAARAIFPNTKIVIHFQDGQKSLYSSFTSIVKDLDMDILGFSLYPEYTNNGSYWVADVNGISESQYSKCAKVMNSFATSYKKETMICEIGTTNIEKETAGATLKTAFDYIKTNVSSCKGIFYWEPECYNSFNNYGMGGFTTSGKPADALVTTYKH